VLTRDGDGFLLNGHRTFASGASLGDQLSITAALDGELAFVSIPGGREGLHPLRNWDNIGQRLTDSGGVELHNVRVGRSEILGADPIGGRELTPYQTLVTPHWQLAFVNFYIGTAQGALAEALDWTRANAVPFGRSITARPSSPSTAEAGGETSPPCRPIPRPIRCASPIGSPTSAGDW
jgi:alkylation response protein AidB-like acyl-CoA dehydrogenase